MFICSSETPIATLDQAQDTGQPSPRPPPSAVPSPALQACCPPPCLCLSQGATEAGWPFTCAPPGIMCVQATVGVRVYMRMDACERVSGGVCTCVWSCVCGGVHMCVGCTCVCTWSCVHTCVCGCVCASVPCSPSSPPGVGGPFHFPWMKCVLGGGHWLRSSCTSGSGSGPAGTVPPCLPPCQRAHQVPRFGGQATGVC